MLSKGRLHLSTADTVELFILTGEVVASSILLTCYFTVKGELRATWTRTHLNSS